ncbi:MAG: 2-hydroxyacyl-CoA dehydratase [bacterium]|nr:2-hydroxyacyl-CoA dehydratase [bacterium]
MRKLNSDRHQRQRKTTMLHLAMEAEEVLGRIGELPGRCKSLKYFGERLLAFSRGELPETTQKRLGTMCVQVPEEILHALGATPVRLCDGSYAYDRVGAEFMPAKSCPLTRATMGKLHINQEFWSDKLDGIVIPTTCDQKRKMAENLATMGYPVINLEMPATRDTELAVAYWQESMKRLAVQIQDITGTKLTRRNLKRAIAASGLSSQLFRKLQRFQQLERPRLYGVDMFLVMSCYFIDEQASWQEAVRTLLAECEEYPADRQVGQPNSPRVLFTGSPAIFPNLKTPLLIEESGGIIVGDESCSSSRILYDAVAYDEDQLYDMLPAVADRYLKPCTCPCFTPNDNRSRKIAELLETCRADGLVYKTLSGCLPYELEQRTVSESLPGDRGPLLFVETDYSPEDVGQLATRVEAFLESIQNRRRKRN